MNRYGDDSPARSVDPGGRSSGTSARYTPAEHEPAGIQPADFRPAPYPAVPGMPMESSRIARSDAPALADLQLHWGEAYLIGLDGDIWSATFRGCADELRAHSSVELRDLIRADYSYRQHAGLTRRGRSVSDPDEVLLPGHPPGQGGLPPIRGERMSL
jgi:hypothetical protein